MKRRKILNLRRIISFLLVFTLFFSQNSMLIFADILKTKSTVKASSNLDDKTSQTNEGTTTNESLSEKTENNSNNNSINLENIKDGSYRITEEGIYPFTGDWGEEYKFDQQQSNESQTKISTYGNYKDGYYYKQLNQKQKLAYDLYYNLLTTSTPGKSMDVYKYKISASDLYGVYYTVIHENTEIFWGRDLILSADNQGIVRKIKYETPFSNKELKKMKSDQDKGLEKAINEINSKLSKNPTKFEKVKAIHDYLVINNRYGTEGCPEQIHGDKPSHLGCKGMFIQQSAYGALVKSEKYGVVCEGFSSAFVLLCKCFDIEALFDAGYNLEGNSFHAWNYVKMDDDKWYVVDLVYDNSYMKTDGLVYRLFLSGRENPNFVYRHDENFCFNFDQTYTGPKYSIPNISKNSYVKFEVIYPEKGIDRNIFTTFSDLLDNFQKLRLPGNHTILLKDNYNLTETDVKKMKEYKVNCKQQFTLKTEALKGNGLYTLNSNVTEVYFPQSLCLENIIYEIASTFVEGDDIIVNKGVRNDQNRCNLYLLGKGDRTYGSTLSISSGSWNEVVGVFSKSPNNLDNIHSNTLNINLEGSTIDNMIIAQGEDVRGNINVQMLNGCSIRNFSYGDGIYLDEGNSLNINVSGATVRTFVKNTTPIHANTNINVTSGIVQNLIGPTVVNDNNRCTTTININANINVRTIIDFDNLVIGRGNTLNVTDELNYNKNNNNRVGTVKFSGKSTLKLPKKISKVGSLISNGDSNSLVISKENAYLNINEQLIDQGRPVTIKYDQGLYPKNGDLLVNFNRVDDIRLNNFLNGVNQRFDLDFDESTSSIVLFSSKSPIKVKFKNGDVYKFNSLYEALEYIQQRSDKNVREVNFCISENYELSRQDLDKLKSYESKLYNQKFVFTSENQDIVLSTSDNLIFPFSDGVLEIEFKDITLDFDNKNIFAGGNNLTMDESVTVTPRSNIDIYGGSYGEKVTNSRLVLNGGKFNTVYGGGASSNGTVKNNVNISLDKCVLVKGNVYGGAKDDKTGTSKLQGLITINLLGGTVEGNIIGGGKNTQSQMFNKIAINYVATNVDNIYGLSADLDIGSEIKNITININKNANLKILAGFNNLNIRPGVTLDVSKVLKYDAGISSSADGKVILDLGSSLCIPNTNNEENRKIGELSILGDSILKLYKDKYLLIDGNTKAVSGKKIKISYHNDIPDLGDKLVKFTNRSLTSNANFTTDYHFSISADKQTGFLSFSEKTYNVNLYTDTNTFYKTDQVIENQEYTFVEPPKIKGKEFIEWKDKDTNESYRAGQKIRITGDMSVVAQYRNVEEYTVTLKVNGLPYRVDYVRAGSSYTFVPAPPIPEKYFIGWDFEGEETLVDLYSTSLSMIKGVTHIQPGTTIPVDRDLTFDADYRTEVKYDIDYGNGDESSTVHKVYYAGGTMTVPSAPPAGITIPFGKIFGGFRVIFNGIGSMIGGIFNNIFRPGQQITIQPGIKMEAVWVDKLHVNLYDEDGTLRKTNDVGKGLEYVIPKAPKIEYKEFAYWQNKSNPNDIYEENKKITVDTDLDLKPVYKNNKIISLYLNGKQTEYFADLSSALDYLENRSAKVVTFELLEDYALTDPDMEKLRDFNRSDMNFIIRGCNKNKKLRVEKSIKLPTDTTFENIVLKYVSNNNQAIYARGHKLEMGDNIKMEGIGAPILVGGDDEIDVEQSNIIVRSGTYKDIYGGGNSEYRVVNGNTTIELLGGKVLGDIYGGSQSTDLNNNLMKRGTTTIKLCKGEVGGVVSGTSKFLGYGNSNNVNIYLQGTELKQGEVYGGYLDPEQVSNNTGVTTIIVGDNYNLNKLVGFTKLDIKQDVSLAVNQVLSHIGGVQLTQSSGEVCLNGNSTLIIPSTTYDEYRQAGWINSQGSNNKIIVNKGQYLTLTSTKEDEIDNNRVILDFKEPDTSKEISVLLKYTNNKGKAKSKSFKKGQNIQRELVLKGDKEKGVIYSDERNLIRITDPKEKSRGFKTIKEAVESIKSYSPEGKYTVKLLENYKLTEQDISALKNLNRNDVRFVITGLNETTKQKSELKVSSNIMLSTDTKFEDIVFDCGESNDYRIYARGHKLEMGKNIEIKETGAPILLGGEDKKDVNKSEIIVESGTYSNIYGGGYEEYSGVRGNISIELRGGDVRGDIYAGSQDTGLISRGKTDIILSGGTVGGVVSGTSRHLVLDNSNDVNIYLRGTDLKNAEVYGGYPQDKEESHNVGKAIITVEKDATLIKLLGFTKLNIERNVRLEVKKVLNHKGGINATDDSGEVCLNGNSILISPASHNPSEIQIGWLNAKGQNNKIFVYKDMYLTLTSRKDDNISNQIELGFKDILDGAYIDALTRKLILLKYENNKQKAQNNLKWFKRGIYLPDDTRIDADEKDGSIYLEEDIF